MIGDFHFLRPLWLLALLAAVLLAWIVAHREDMHAKWRNIIAPHLLDRLLSKRHSARRLRPVHLTIAAIALGAIAAAGPTWQREKSPLVEEKAPLAIAIDLSQTMDAIDVSPSRLERAKLKIKDLIALRPGARTALFAYAGSPHMVLPLTDDATLLNTYVDSLATRIMPVKGKDTSKALALIDTALAQEGVPGTILFITDGIEESAFPAFKNHTRRNEIMVLGIGTAEGGPVKLANGGYLTTASGVRELAPLDINALNQLKREAGIELATMTLDDSDVQWIAHRAQSHLAEAQSDENTRWQDEGWWLIIPIAVLSAVWFRRGWTISWTAALLIGFMISGAPRAEAAERNAVMDAFLTPDQQGRLAFERGDFVAAAEHFSNPMWQGVAYYRAGKFAEAADAFARLQTAEAYYNGADALAHLGRLQQAITSLQQALKLRPGWPEAEANLQILQKALAAQKQDQEEGAEPEEKPDQLQFDERGKQGKRGEVNLAEQTAEMWMRNIQMTPTDLLARRFFLEAREATP